MSIDIYDFSREVLSDVEALHFVNEDGTPNQHFIVAVKLYFRNVGGVTIKANDDDSISFESLEWSDTDTVPLNVSTSLRWKDMIGNSLMWCWHMKNQCHKDDGVQLQFGKDSVNMCSKIQMIAEASQLTIE
jgi:hypothetical protein